MAYSPEFVFYKPNIGVFFFIAFSAHLFLQAQRKAQPLLTAIGLKRELGTAYAYNSRPLGSGIGRFSSFAVSIHSWITTSTLAKACRYDGPSAAQPGNSGTSAI